MNKWGLEREIGELGSYSEFQTDWGDLVLFLFNWTGEPWSTIHPHGIILCNYFSSKRILRGF
jgi:hypothetical protein